MLSIKDGGAMQLLEAGFKALEGIRDSLRPADRAGVRVQGRVLVYGIAADMGGGCIKSVKLG